MSARHSSLWLSTLLLTACGGGQSPAPAELALSAAPALGERRHAASGQDAATPALKVQALIKLAERRVDRTVYEIDFQVSLRAGELAQTGISARVIGHGAGTTVVSGPLNFGDLAPGALATRTLTLRHDRRQAFDPAQLQWSFQAGFDPALCQLQAGAPGAQTVGVSGMQVMVTSADVRASLAGCRVLARGGSAADAAVTVQAVLGVTEPFGSSLAGGTLITYFHAADGQVRVFDGLSSAPANTGGATSINRVVAGDEKCRPNRTVGSALSAWNENTDISGRAVGVPGTVKVLDLVHGRYGQRPWNTLWDEAIDHARQGFTMSQYMFENLWNDGRDGRPAGALPAWVDGTAATATEPEVVRWGPPRCKYKDIRARYCDLSDTTNQQTPKPAGALLFNPELADTMTLLRDQGAAVFYDPNGPIVRALLQRFKADRWVLDAQGNPVPGADGQPQNNCYSSTLARAYDPAKPWDTNEPARIPSLMSAQDFADYRALERAPLRGQRFGLDIHTAPPPSGGGLVVLSNLGVAQRKFGTNGAGVAFGSDDYLYTMMEASRLSTTDRRAFSGDPDYSNSLVRVQAALADAYLDGRAALITGTALSSTSPGTGLPPFEAGPLGLAQAAAAVPTALPQERGRDSTSHVSIVDRAGNALAMTTTINTHWGAHIEAGGMLLNNALSLFTQGTTTLGFDVNRLQGGKRPRTSMSPSIALTPVAAAVPGGARTAPALRLVWGAAGGTYIPDYVTNTFLGTAVAGIDPQAAMNAGYWSGQDGLGELEITHPVAERLLPLRSSRGYTDSTLDLGRLRGGSAAIAVQGPVGDYRLLGAADARRAGGAAGR